MTEKLALETKGICKAFAGVKVLKQVDFAVQQGEVHGLMGENGAGKSTLIKILTGVYTKDEGTIFIDGQATEINSRADAANAGISVIYQELSVVSSLTVTQNIYLGHEATKGLFLSQKEMAANVKDLIEMYDFDLKPDEIVGNLSIAKRQSVEILKALSTNANIIIMDEPTASLTAKECDMLFDIIRKLKSQGKSVIYISHRLDEINLLVDRLTVLRDGEVVGVLGNNEIDPIEVIRMMIGRELDDGRKTPCHKAKGDHVLEVRHLSIGGLLRDINFKAYDGQILGVGGLVGSGRTEVLKSIFGLMPYDAGEILLDGKALGKNPQKNLRAGVSLVPEDRRVEGFVPGMSVAENLMVCSYDKLSWRNVFVKHKRARAEAVRVMEDVDVRPKNPDLRTINLSGGNQQKVVLGKWLMRDDLRVLLVDEPTVGIDVGAKDQIYTIMRNLAENGVIVIMVSSDLRELVTVSDRILVMYRGRVFKEFPDANITQEDVLVAASGINREEGQS